MKILLLAALLLCGFSAMPVISEEREDRLEHTLVTDQDIPPQSISEVDLTMYTGFVKIISREEFSDRMSSFSEVLDVLPGIQVNETGGLGSNSSVSIRGSGGKQVNIFLDGMLLNSPLSGAAAIQNIPTVLIENVQVFPDFTPAELGNANLAGAVNFKTRVIKSDDAGGRISAATGSFSTRSSEVSGWNRIGKWQFVGAFGTQNSDNDFRLVTYTDYATYDEDSKHRRNDGFSQKTAFLKARREFGKHNFHSMFQHTSVLKELPTANNRLIDSATLETDSLRFQGVLDFDLDFVKLAHRFFILSDEQIFLDPNSTIGLLPNNDVTNLDSYGSFNVAKFPLDSRNIVVGLEYRKDAIDSHDRRQDRRVADLGRETIVASISDDWAFQPDWRMNSTVRFTYSDYSVDFVSSEEDSDTSTVSEGAYQLGLKWKMNDHLEWKTNIGRMIRIPDLTEKFGTQGSLEGSEDLRPEKTLFSYDAGFDFSLSNVRGGASVYFNKVSDGIVTIYDSRGIGRAENIGLFQRLGVEAQLHWSPVSWLEFNLAGNFLDTENKSGQPANIGKKLPNVYHENYSMGATIEYWQNSISINYQVYDLLYYEKVNAIAAQRKEELSASFTFRFEPYTLDVSARNLFNKNFIDRNRFPVPGRSYLATLTFDF